MAESGVMDTLRNAIRGPGNEYTSRWKQDGRHIIGHFCTYVPAELITAAGMLPVRIRGAGSSDSGPADVYLSSRLCTYIRHATALALEEKYSFLDGEIALNTCDHVRRCHDVWVKKTEIPFHGFLSVPRKQGESLYPWYKEEVENLKGGLEDHFGVEITRNNIADAIHLHNEVKKRLINLNEFRRSDPPKLKGSQALTVAVASQVMPREEFIRLADELLAELKEAPPPEEKPRARVVVVGGELDEPRFLEVIESMGAAVVGDGVCFGTRYFDELIPEAGDPFETMCRHTFFRVPCSRMVGGFPKRYEYVEQLTSHCQADGVIFQKMKFCDPWSAEAHNMLHRFKNTDGHLLILEREYDVIATGQVKTRVQAFMEAMGK